jgi:hypothetical protein
MDENEELCAFFAYEVLSGTIVEQLDGDFLPSWPSDMYLHHPYQYPDMNLNETLDVTTSGGSLLRYASDGKNWNRYNACYVYRHQQLHLVTTRNVERGEKLILPKGAAHWQGSEEGLLYEYAYATEHKLGEGCVNLAERFESLRCFKRETGMVATLITYQDWTAELQHRQSCVNELIMDDINFDTACFLYFRNVLGLGSNIDSQGECVQLNKDLRDFPPYEPD